MKLHELHVDQFRARVVGQSDTIAGAFPTVAGDLVGPSETTRREHHRLGLEHLEAPPLPLIRQRADDTRAIFEQRHHRVLHVNVNALMNAMVLQRADQLQSRAIADMREARILVPAEVALKDASIRRAVKHRAPRLEFAHTIRRLFGMNLRHAPVVHVLPAAHRVGEMHAPVVAIIHVRQRRRDAALGHAGVGLAEQ